jgi:acetyltransferase-like isoleucine patch superfamily enzyme
VTAEAAAAENQPPPYASHPGLKLPPPPRMATKTEDGKTVSYKMQDMSFNRKAWNRISMLLYNMIVTYIPSHTIRQGFLRLSGATIGKNSTIMRGTTVIDTEFITIGDGSVIGFRCLLDGRAGLYIGNNVTAASDTQFIAGGHDINHPDFLPMPVPTVIEDYVWIASRATVLPCHIGRGGVVGAAALVTKNVGELEVVGGVPAKVIGKRNPEALRYSAAYRPLFF